MIELLVDKVKDELPGYMLIGYKEICIPIYRRMIHCTVITRQQLGVVEEFVLRLVNENVDIPTIALILGIDESIINDAWWNLIQKDFIDHKRNELTETGENYLNEVPIDAYESILLKCYIDGLTGNISRDNAYLMNAKSVRENGLPSIRPLVTNPTLNDINFTQTKRVLKEIQKIDKEDNYVDLLDIYKIEGNTTDYKRIQLFIFSNGQNNRFLVYDTTESKIDDYNDCIEKAVEINKNITPASSTYFDDINSINILEKYGIGEQLFPGQIQTLWDEIIADSKNSLTIVLPLVEMCIPTNSFLESLEKALKKGIDVSIIILGRPLLNEHQKKQYNKLISFKKAHQNLTVLHSPRFNNKAIIGDEKGIISCYTKTPFGENEGIVEYGKYMNPSLIQDFLDGLEIPRSFLDIELDQLMVKQRILRILKLSNDLDGFIKNTNNIGWFGKDPIPHYDNIISVPLATDENKFKTFISSFHNSLYEVIINVGKSNSVNNYFWGEFKSICPGVHRVLDKIRVYRNSVNHLDLNEENRKKYFEYLDEDICGCLPNLVKNGYLIIQQIILMELENEMIKILETPT